MAPCERGALSMIVEFFATSPLSKLPEAASLGYGIALKRFRGKRGVFFNGF
ncbi:hypothetical protein AcV7_001525 [Taiwanofungus camphoratus]|nr:hypothetical protein AcV7_001525 [Antrodia cinnamomea]